MRDRIIEMILQLAFNLIVGALKRHSDTKDLPVSLMSLEQNTQSPLDRFLVAKIVGPLHTQILLGGEESNNGPVV